MKKFVWILLILLLAACESQNQQESQENRTPTTTEPAQSDPSYSVDMHLGEKIYYEVCATCHQEGIAGAPKMGDKEAWQPSIAKGMKALVRNSIEGYQGNRGVMPPRGGVKSLTDEEVISAVAYIVRQNR